MSCHVAEQSAYLKRNMDEKKYNQLQKISEMF